MLQDKLISPITESLNYINVGLSEGRSNEIIHNSSEFEALLNKQCTFMALPNANCTIIANAHQYN